MHALESFNVCGSVRVQCSLRCPCLLLSLVHTCAVTWLLCLLLSLPWKACSKRSLCASPLSLLGRVHPGHMSLCVSPLCWGACNGRVSTSAQWLIACNPLVGFDELNNNTFKGLTSLLNIEQKIQSIAYTYGLWNEKWLKVQQEGKLDDIPHNVQIKAKVVYCCVRRS